MKWIDAHVHVSSSLNIPVSDVLAAIKRIITDNGLDALNIVSIPCMDEDSALQNLMALLCKSQNSSEMYFFGGLEYYLYPGRPHDCGFAEQLDTLLQMGADGVKILESKPSIRKRIGDIPLTHPSYSGFFKRLEKDGIPVVWHTADPEICWDPNMAPQFFRDMGWYYCDGTYHEREYYYQEAFDILAQYPKIKVVFAHMMLLTEDIREADETLEQYPNICFDLTPNPGMYGDFAKKPDEWHSFFLKHQDRIIFGTDRGYYIEESIKQGRDIDLHAALSIRRFLETSDECDVFDVRTKGIALPADVVEKILYHNFLNMVHAQPPRKICKESVLRYSDHLTMQLQNSIVKPPKNTGQLINRISEIQSLFQWL